MGGLGRTLALPSTPGPVLLSSPDPGVTSIGRPTGGELLVGWDPCPHQCTWDGWGRGPGHPRRLCPAGQPAAEPACSTQPLPHTGRGLLVLVVTGKVGRAVGCSLCSSSRWALMAESHPLWTVGGGEPLSLPCTCCAPTPTPHPMNTGSALGCGRYGEPLGG